jgi:hypothetical protein
VSEGGGSLGPAADDDVSPLAGAGESLGRRSAALGGGLDSAMSRLSRPARKSRLGGAPKVRFPAMSLGLSVARPGQERL